MNKTKEKTDKKIDREKYYERIEYLKYWLKDCQKKTKDLLSGDYEGMTKILKGNLREICFFLESEIKKVSGMKGEVFNLYEKEVDLFEKRIEEKMNILNNTDAYICKLEDKYYGEEFKKFNR
jgi:hypothetical protein